MVDGREILVGRSSRENDELTFQMAAPDDFWLHAGDYSGSHVVVRNPQGTRIRLRTSLRKRRNWRHIFRRRETLRKWKCTTPRKHVPSPGAQNRIWCGFWNSNQLRWNPELAQRITEIMLQFDYTNVLDSAVRHSRNSEDRLRKGREILATYHRCVESRAHIGNAGLCEICLR